MKTKFAPLMLTVLLAFPAPWTSSGQTTLSVTTVHTFTAPGGVYPGTPPVPDADGNFYGTTEKGGAYNTGTVFKTTPAGVFTIVYNFSALDSDGHNGDGANPLTLARGRDGNFYGTAVSGGSNGTGTVFRITPAGVFTVLTTEARGQTSPLVQGSDGNFYGTIRFGGTNGTGSVFKLTPAGVFTTLHSFAAYGSQGNSDGENPDTALVQGGDGAFYGVASNGGPNNAGAIFKITPARAFAVVHSFSALDGSYKNNDGAFSRVALVRGNDGNFYSAATNGGGNGHGTVFKMTPAGMVTVLHTFSVTDSEGNNADGANPVSLILGSDGYFYGTTLGGGTNHTGTVFKITPAGVFTTLHHSTAAEGSVSVALAQGGDGNFYGVAPGGGSDQAGTFVKMTPAGTLTILREFVFSQGAYPTAALVLGGDGNFYGTTSGFVNGSGARGYGSVFKMTPAGALTTLHRFTGGDGQEPDGTLAEDGDGNFYGTARFGGEAGTGTVFRITPAGALTTLHHFSAVDDDDVNADGDGPQAGLARGNDGNFYGTTYTGGAYGYGTIFEVTPAGQFTVLHSFSGIGKQGRYSTAALVLGGDGNFYGTNSESGVDNSGTVFKITPAGALTTLHGFKRNDTEGGVPRAGLNQGRDGSFYGTTSKGGKYDIGTVFKITRAGVLTDLNNISDGVEPLAPLAQGRDGDFYGTTSGGYEGRGTVFKMTPAGVLTTLHTFGSENESVVLPAGLAQGRDGSFYGLTLSGASSFGTIFRLGYYPAITSPATATATVNKAFSYQIKATNSPTSYGVIGLPAGLTVNRATGVVSGTLTAPGKKTLTLQAANASGTGTATLTLNIVDLPKITSPATASTAAGKPYSYQITATNQPTGYGVLGLAPGLKVDGKTGLISGTPTKAGMPSLTLKATNVAGTGSATLKLTIKAE